MLHKHPLAAALFTLLIVGLLGIVLFRVSDAPSSQKEADGGKSAAREAGAIRREGERGATTPVPSLSIHLQQLLGDDSNMAGKMRIAWVGKHGADLEENEVETILAFLHSGRVPAGLSEGEWYWLVDELFTALRAGTGSPQKLTGQLAELFADTALDLVVRDYALQHLGHLGGEGGDLETIRAAAATGLEETATPIAGTALLVLHNDPGGSAVEGDRTAAAAPNGPNDTGAPAQTRDPGLLALGLLGNEQASVASKVTAFQVAARHKAAGTRSAAVAALGGDAPLLLRFAAVAALGEVGTPADLPLLQSLPADNKRLQQAVESAMRKLTSSN